VDEIKANVFVVVHPTSGEPLAVLLPATYSKCGEFVWAVDARSALEPIYLPRREAYRPANEEETRAIVEALNADGYDLTVVNRSLGELVKGTRK
jgi:hypothetical protein